MNKGQTGKKSVTDLATAFQSGCFVSWRDTDEYGFPDRRFGLVWSVEEDALQVFDGGKLISFSKQECKTRKVRALSSENVVKALNDRVSTDTLANMLSEKGSESYNDGESRANADHARAARDAYDRLPQAEKDNIRWEQDRASDRLVN